MNGCLNIIKELIDSEFRKKVSHPTTILRQNSMVSKMMGKYTKIIGERYLFSMLSELVEDLFQKNETVILEVNPNKLTGDDIEKQIEANYIDLETTCQKFVDTIIKKGQEEMPIEMRALCYFIVSSGKKYGLNYKTTTLPLISGYIMLRFICPGITVPNVYGIVDSKKVPMGNIRNNLTIIATVLQKLANGESFGNETEHMKRMNLFIEKNKDALFNFLEVIPLNMEDKELGEKYETLFKPITFEKINKMVFLREDLKLFHKIFFDIGYELLENIMENENEKKSTYDYISLGSELLTAMHDLGVPKKKRRRRGERRKRKRKKKEKNK